MSTRIYGLHDPDSGELRYVGKTVQPLGYRMRNHRYQAKRSDLHLQRWWRSCSSEPVMRLIAIVEDYMGSVVERRLIAWHRKNGARLTNTTDGGEGTRAPKSPEHRAKISAALKGRRFTKEWREKIKVGLSERDQAYRKKISEANRNRAQEVNERIAETLRGLHRRGHWQHDASGRFIKREESK
jgi:hypothetical protein